MSDLNPNEITELLMRLEPEHDIEWADGSSMATYAKGYVALWDSHGNLILIEEPQVTERTYMYNICVEEPIEVWPWDQWSTICDYPDIPFDNKTFTYLKENLA